MKTQKTLVISCILGFVVCGCGSMKYHKEITKLDGSKEVVDFTGKSGFSKSTLNGLTIDGVTKTTSQGLKIGGVSTVPDPESINATVGGAGTLIGEAAKVYMGGKP